MYSHKKPRVGSFLSELLNSRPDPISFGDYLRLSAQAHRSRGNHRSGEKLEYAADFHKKVLYREFPVTEAISFPISRNAPRTKNLQIGIRYYMQSHGYLSFAEQWRPLIPGLIRFRNDHNEEIGVRLQKLPGRLFLTVYDTGNDNSGRTAA
jgi:hypothetical protein